MDERIKVCSVAIRRGIQQLAYSMAMPKPQESTEENKYLNHRMSFALEDQRSHIKKL